MLKFIFRFIITFIIWVLFWIPFYILGFFVTWLGLLFLNRNSEHMIPLFWPWDNSHGVNGTLPSFDNPVNNPKWVLLCNPETFNTLPAESVWNTILEIVKNKSGNERTFSKRWVWCTWRNPVSNLSLYFLGKKVKNPIHIKKYNFNFFIIEKVTSQGGWFYSITIPYNDERCFYHSFGWKYLDLYVNESYSRARFIFRISPYREIPK